MYTDDTILTTGKHKFTALCRVPPYYLIKIYTKKNKSIPELYEYVERNYELILARHMGLAEIPEFSVECQKVIYFSEKAAKAELHRIAHIEQSHKKPVRAYECSICGGFHLTSWPLEQHKL